eukprot:GFUD01011260.1.p1 GENE.GFUD01011260.1~~GFUD01011260.1.p1  ORF type:complete len:1434 (+),score=529.61 GFUD01011260.1:103-4404(+)
MTESEAPMDPQVTKSVAKLADLLRKVGSRVLTNSCALSLSWPVYHQIATALSLFASHTTEQSKYLDCKLILDLEYLKSFLSRVPSLRLYHTSNQEFSGLIYLAGLIHLRHLDLRRLPVHLIQDLDSVRPQLRSLSVTKCSFGVEELLSACLGSQPTPSPWSSLSNLTMSHCSLTTLSAALSCTPHLTHLDCSHNQLSTTPGLELLSNLSHLILSYNHLARVPPTHDSALLTHLSLAYNRLEQLSPLSDLAYLEQLDLSGNCLMHHDALAPISALSKLLQIDIQYNPLSTHPKHRILASSWFNPALASSVPILDTIALSRAELVMIGSSRQIISPSVSPSSPLCEPNDSSITSIPFNLDDLPESASCTGSREGSIVSGYTVTTVGGSRRKKGKRKKKVMREAVISDETDYTETDTDRATTETEPDIEPSKVGVGAAVTKAIVTASTLVELREQYGEDWLRAGAGDKLHSLLGIQEVEVEKDTDTIIHDMVAKETELQRQVSVQRQASVAESEVSEVSKAGSRRSSDEAVDAIEQADVVMREEENDVTKSLEEMVSKERELNRVSTVSNKSNDSTGFYSVYTDRETSPGAVDKGAMVAVLRAIPGDDSGEVEELVLSISSEFIREQDLKGITRVKWFLHSIEQLDMVGRVKGDRIKSQHVLGDKVKCALLFNTVRRDSRERVYTMSEAGYSTLMALAGPVLETAASANASVPSLQCVKCHSVFSAGVAVKTKQGSRCPNCGSSMVIESQPDPEQEDEEEGVSLGIPACEMLDLTAIAETANRASTPRTFSRELSMEAVAESQPEKSYLGQELPISPIKSAVTNLSVTADIHNHVVNSPDANLPDLLPRPEPKRSRNSSDEEGGTSQGKEKSSSPSLLRSDSSSDISVLSNPSECSIEVISMRGEQDLSVPAASQGDAVTPVQGDHKMVESSSSGSMVDSVVAAEAGNDTFDSQNTPTKYNEDSAGSPTTHNRNRSTTSSNSLSPTKKRLETDTVSMDEDSSVFHSCQEDTDTSLVEDCELTSASTMLDLSETLSVESARSAGGSQGASPITVKSQTSTPLGASPLTLATASQPQPAASPEPVEQISPISWNYSDYTMADHRVQLYCELSLFREEEDLLLLAKGSLHLRSTSSSLWEGVLVVTNKRIYALRITGKETEEPGDWLELRSSANVQKLSRLVGLVGGQGVGLELQSNSKPAQPSFYRLPGVAGYSSGYSGEGTDCYYLVMGDRGRVDRMMDQLVERLQEAVRSTPIPVTRLSQDEEAVISAQVARVSPEAEPRVELFQMARMLEDGADEWERVSIIVTPSHIVVAQDFFHWLFTCKDKQLQIIGKEKIENLNNLAIYQTWPERTRLELADLKLKLKFETEAGVQELVGSIREAWELARGVKLEEVTSFHLSGSKEVVVMQTLLMDQSVTLESFDLTQWIKVTSQGKGKI